MASLRTSDVQTSTVAAHLELFCLMTHRSCYYSSVNDQISAPDGVMKKKLILRTVYWPELEALCSRRRYRTSDF
jgi:hypothetical protein